MDFPSFISGIPAWNPVPYPAFPGVLAHLEMLEFREHREAVEQEEKERREEKSAFLKAKIRELRLQRDRLREKLELLEKAVRAEFREEFSREFSAPLHPWKFPLWDEL